MIVLRSTFTLFLILILFIHTFNALNPAYYRQQEEQLADLIESINDQHSNIDLSEIGEDNDQVVKRNKYPNFYVSPLWLSRRTRTNRLYGKPLWISRTG
jgi:hypothetical protein